MEITQEQFSRIEEFLPVQRGNVSLSNLQVVNAILFVAENGCKWRSLPKRFGNWHTIYTRMNRWAKAGVLDRLFEELPASAAGAHQDRSGESGQHAHRQSTSGRDWCSKKTALKPSAIQSRMEHQNSLWLPRMLGAPSLLSESGTSGRCA